MRALSAVLLLLAVPAIAEDLVHLRRGGMLRGEVVSETEGAVVLDLGSGTMRIPRERIRLVERSGPPRVSNRRVTQRDEWFLVLHRGEVAGWRRLIHTEGPERIQVEERTVFFRPGGGDDVEIRRVEVADRGGRPLEFLLLERYGHEAEIVNGQVVDGELLVQERRDGALRTRVVAMPDGWVLALPAWSRFLREAEPGESRAIQALDPSGLRPVRLLLRRDEDAPDPTARDPRPCRAVRLQGDVRQARALYRPGDGSVAIELNGPSLVAERVTQERVELARRAHAAPRPLSLDQAQRFPFHERSRDLTAFNAHAGVALTPPDAGWVAQASEEREGLVLSFEKVGIFASVELFVYPVSDADVDECLRRALARLALTAATVRPIGDPLEGVVDGLPARTQAFTAEHRGEQLRGLLTVVRAKGRYAILVGAAPVRWRRWAERDFREFIQTLEIAN